MDLTYVFIGIILFLTGICVGLLLAMNVFEKYRVSNKIDRLLNYWGLLDKE